MPRFLALGTGVLAAAFLLAAVFLPWFRVPMAGGSGELAGIEPPATLVLKALCLAAAAFCGIVWRGPRGRPRAARVLALLFVALLFFPSLVMIWSPAAAAQAGWLQTQHESLSWLGGDIFAEQSAKGGADKNAVRVTPLEGSGVALHLPVAAAAAETSWLPRFFEWLGYTNRFCQFANRGWFLALGGALLALVALCRGSGGFSFPLFHTITRTGFAGLAAGCALALLPIFVAGTFVANSRRAAERADAAGARRWLDRAAGVLPVLRQDSDFLAQQGYLENRLGMGTPAAALYRATELDKQGFEDRAQAEFAILLAASPAHSAVRREAVCALLYSAAQALNSGRAEAAAATLDQVLEYDPANLKALHALQLACLRMPQPARLPALVARTDAVYRFFSTRTKAPVLAAAFEKAALAAQMHGQTDEALALRRVSLGRPR